MSWGRGWNPRGKELELELVQFQMAQKPVLRGEVGARALRVRSVSRDEVWATTSTRSTCLSAVGCYKKKPSSFLGNSADVNLI